MDEVADQRTVIKRLWEQIVNLFYWIKEQVQSNPSQSLLVVFASLAFYWIIRETHRFDNMGFGDKTFWDWMDLLIIPIVVAIGAWWLNKSERENEQEIAEDRRNQEALEAYFDRMVELLLKHDLIHNRSVKKRETLADIARTRTLAVLRSLDGNRKAQVVQFLRESGLIDPEGAIVVLRWADLSGAVLWWADVSEADLSGADLSGAKLRRADLSGANLSGADLSGADLNRADLSGAKLSGAVLRWVYLSGAKLHDVDLTRANVTPEQLAQAKSLEGATLPDGTKHD